jgi:flagellar biosynthesis protein
MQAYGENAELGDARSAIGSKMIAQQILNKAKREGVPTSEDNELMGLLMQVDVDKAVPELAFSVLGELASWVSRLDGELHRR